MSLLLLKEQAEKAGQTLDIPKWVSTKNKTYEIYQSALSIFSDKEAFISQQKNLTGFKKKSNYQISISELARTVNLADTTLAHTSAYSKELKIYIDGLNANLNKLKENKCKLIVKRKSQGSRAKNKDEVLQRLKKVESELKLAKALNASEQVSQLLNGMSLPVRRKLGL